MISYREKEEKVYKEAREVGTVLSRVSKVTLTEKLQESRKVSEEHLSQRTCKCLGKGVDAIVSPPPKKWIKNADLSQVMEMETIMAMMPES